MKKNSTREASKAPCNLQTSSNDTSSPGKGTGSFSLRCDALEARSPDLAPCDFFLWGYLKSIVYNDRPRTLAHLKTNIRNAIAEIPVGMLQRVARNFRNRLNQRIDNGGRHLTDVIFKTAWKKIWWGDL